MTSTEVELALLMGSHTIRLHWALAAGRAERELDHEPSQPTSGVHVGHFVLPALVVAVQQDAALEAVSGPIAQCLGFCPEEPMVDRDLSGRTLGDFVLREKIGEGGYGAVYRCEQPQLKREVVVKVLHPRQQSDDIAPDRFLREAQLASRLDHPYAAHVYAFGVAEVDGLQWIAMELVQGITLSDWLEAHGPMPLEQFVPFFECVADVVQTAHERGIVHRDLKPSNIMVIERGGRLFPKLLDFGIAKLNHEIPGTPRSKPRSYEFDIRFHTVPAAMRLPRDAGRQGIWEDEP